MTSISSLKLKRQAKRRTRLEDRVKKYTKRGTSVNKRGATRAAAGESREQQDKKSAKHFLKAHTAKEKLAKMDKRAEKQAKGPKSTPVRSKPKGKRGGTATTQAVGESGGGFPKRKRGGTATTQAVGESGSSTRRTKPKGPSPTPYRGAAPTNSGTMKPGPRPSPIKGGSGGNGTYKKPTPSTSKRAPKKGTPMRSAPKRSASKARPAARKRTRRSKK